MAQTEVGGEVSGEWTREGSPYILIDTTFVITDEVLTIREGVTVDFNSFPIMLFGSINATGTERDTIYFVGVEDFRFGIFNRGWRGNQRARSLRMEYVHHEPDNHNLTTARLAVNDFIVRNSEPSDCLVESSLRAEISDNVFSNATMELGGQPNDLLLGHNHFDNGIIRFVEFQNIEISGQTGNRGFMVFLGSTDRVEIFDITGLSLYMSNDSLDRHLGGINIRDSQFKILWFLNTNDVRINNCTMSHFNSNTSTNFDFGSSEVSEQFGLYETVSVNFHNSYLRLIDNSVIDDCEDIVFQNCRFLLQFQRNHNNIDLRDCDTISFLNCSMMNQTKPRGGLFRFFNSERIAINNCIFTSCSKVDELIDGHCRALWFTYNCLYNISQIYQADTSRIEDNLYIDPMLAGGRPFDFHLRPGSPCIDAGNPDNPEDPDGTPADIGAIYYNQEGNNAPIITSEWLEFAGRGREYEYVATAVDEGETNFVFSDLPEWLEEIDPGVVSGVTPEDCDSVTFILTCENEQENQDITLVDVIGVDGKPLRWALTGVLPFEDSPYAIVDDVYIPTDSTLTIEAGCDIDNLTPREDQYKNAHKFLPDGNLKILGTPDNMVSIHSDYPIGEEAPNDYQWQGIRRNYENSTPVDTLIIRYLDMYGSNNGISLSRFRHSEIVGCNLHDNGNGITIRSDYARVDSNTIVGRDYEFERIIHGSGGISVNGINASIRRNKIISHNQTGISCTSDIQEISYNYIERCGLSRGNPDNGRDGINCQPDSIGGIVHHNLLVNNGAGISLASGNGQDSHVKGKIYSNTIIRCWNESAIRLSGMDTAEVYNNLVYNAPQAVHFSNVDFSAPQSINNNLFFSCDEDFDYYLIPGYGVDTTLNHNGDQCDSFGNIFIDPELIGFGHDPYGLRQDSPAINAGSGVVDEDADGTISDIGYRPFDHNNPIPEIVQYVPEEQLYRLPHFGYLLFSMNAFDIDEDDLIGRYLLNGEAVSEELSDTIYFAERQAYQVIGEVTDGNSVVSTNWIVYVGRLEADHTEDIPLKYELIGIYPNPLNGIGTLQFSLDVGTKVHITIYNIIGRSVINSDLGHLPAGLHEATIKMDNLSSGTYVAILETPAGIRRCTVHLIK
ncbi:MAG: T9SS type A sorting domain-containing protein [Calditrichaeota bacterium]|nr:T9SS type A sorting domain-containing protein [Calditrichota bacterium]